MDGDDAVFKALADPTRRALLDRLREHNGQTLGELCEPLDMARQSATQHLGVLEAANLITTVRRGREKLHYLNPVPLWAIQKRWIDRFERPRLRALSAIKHQAEEDSPVMTQTTLTKAPAVHVGMRIRRPPADVFEALAEPAITTRFWYTGSTGRMTQGAELTWTWEMYHVSSTVRVLDVQPGRRIRFSWDGYDAAHPTTVEFQFIPYADDTTYLRVTETGFTGDPDTQVSRALDSTAGFTFLLSSLKAALEHDITLRVVLDAHPPNVPEL